jgi:predicted RNA polymerase sigma factor
LARADALTTVPGPYALQARIAACHARAFHADETDWDELVRLYTDLARVEPSPIIELNRAVAVSRALGSEEALALVDLLVATGTLERYHLLWSVRGDLLERLGRHDEAAVQFERAAHLTTNEQERALLTGRARTNAARTSGSQGITADSTG